jgi:hypothetical protein
VGVLGGEANNSSPYKNSALRNVIQGLEIQRIPSNDLFVPAEVNTKKVPKLYQGLHTGNSTHFYLLKKGGEGLCGEDSRTIHEMLCRYEGSTPL